MARQDEFQAQSPVQLHYDWRSDQNSFCFYDKDTESRIPTGVPFKFAVLKQAIRITGVDSNNIGLYSNEVKNTTKEQLFVRRQDGSEVAKGFWKDIKDVVKQNGGNYTKIIYGMDIDGVIISLRIKGESLISWGHIVGKNERRFGDEWILNDSFESKEFVQSNGAVQPYSIPSFKFGGSFTAEDIIQADNAYDAIDSYLSGKSEGNQTAAQVASAHTMPQSGPPADLFVPPSNDDDDLPF